MSIISISFSEENLRSLDHLQKANNLSGRSEAMRVALRCAEAEVRDRESLNGEVEGVLIVAPVLDALKHDFQQITPTQIHSHLKSNKCLEVFIIRGEAALVQEMVASFQKDDMINYVKFVQS